MPTVSLSPILSATTILDNLGNILINGTITSYLAGSTTPTPTYSNNTGTIVNTNPIVIQTTGRIPLLYLDITISYKFIINDASGNQLAIYDNINSILTANNPFLSTGMIMLWSGNISAIPTGWALCDGQSGRPDLRDKFVVGAGNSYRQGDTGGSPNAVIVAHTHNATVVDPGHTHTYIRDKDVANLSSHQYSDSNAGPLQTSRNTTGISVTISSTGQSGTNANLPPYYAVAYIYKL